MADDFSLWDVLVSMFWFMLLFAWIWLLISILGDIFRDRELGGGAKAMWTIFLIFLPWLGALVYLIARGDSMNKRHVQAAEEQAAQFKAYVQDAAGTPSTAEELKKLTELRDAGAITPAEYDQAKAKILA
ncbi:MAG TPA: SHOCT domain-containing protein [Marmoricola sp.]|nr:SHOCT domain-containing protein [Marmoricola sp.]